MHEIVRLLVNGPPVQDNSLKIAIITAASVVIAAAITAFASTFTRARRNENRTEQEYVDELVRRAEVAERRAQRMEESRDSLQDRVDELEGYCWRAGIDPNTGHPVVQGSEPREGDG